MIQMLTRIAITFQSTRPKASTSVITPSHTIATTPISAATVLSTTLTITTMIVITNTAIAIHAMASIDNLP